MDTSLDVYVKQVEFNKAHYWGHYFFLVYVYDLPDRIVNQTFSFAEVLKSYVWNIKRL